ncbi:MAG: hypothetical protein FJ254_04275 [Phycisphaerae bacterium]|nr:hypothetical protein [Phycisphaerae bacterium]
MKSTCLTVCLTTLALTACAVPTHTQPQDIADPSDCPKDWLRLSSDDSRVKQLSPALRTERMELRDQRRAVNGTELNLDLSGHPELQSKVDDFNRRATQWYATSAYAILKDPSPEMYSISQTHDGGDRNNAIALNQNMRILTDDWNRFWMWGFPSMLSPTPIMDTSGQPR